MYSKPHLQDNDKAKKSTVQRYHALLATSEQTNNDKTLMLSDHLPRLFILPEKQGSLRIITYNVFVPNQGSGFYPTKEMPEDYAERLKRLQAAIVLMVKQQSPHIIVMQELWFQEEFPNALRMLCQELGDNWQYINNGYGQASFYNADFIQLEKNIEIAQSFWKSRRQELHIQYSLDQGAHTFSYVLHNVHLPHEETPEVTEKIIGDLLKASQGKIAIVVGDFNSRCYPISHDLLAVEEKINLVGNVVSAEFKSAKIQGVDSTDGLFFIDEDNKIRQANSEIIIPTTGKIYEQEISFEAWFEQLTEQQQAEVLLPRMHLCLSAEYEIQIGNKALNKYQDKLRRLTKCPGLIVRFARNFCNEKFIGIAFNPVSKNKLAMNPKLAEQTYLNAIKPYIKGMPTIQLMNHIIEKSSPPIIFIEIQFFIELVSYIELYHVMSYEADELNKFLANKTYDIPELIRNHIEHILLSIDRNGDDSEKNLHMLLGNLRASQVLIEIYPSFYKNNFIHGVLEYAIRGGRVADVSRFLDALREQVERWSKEPPKNPTYAREIIEWIKTTHIFKKYDRLKPLKAKLYYLQAIIHQDGVLGVEKNLNQAIASFHDAAINGNQEAYMRLGDIKLKEAQHNHSNSTQLQDNSTFIAALQYYKKAGQLGLYGLSNAILMNYNHNLQYGNFKTASECLSYLDELIDHYPKDKLILSKENILESKFYLEDLKKALNDAMKIESHYIKCKKYEFHDIEDKYLSLKDVITDDNVNPIFDYYYLNVLLQKSRQMKSSKNNEEQKDSLNYRIESLTRNLLNFESYPPSRRGELYYVYGLGLLDRLPSFIKALSQQMSSKDCFMAAIKKGFPLGYSYLANIAEMEKIETDTTVYSYYLCGALAGDARCQISFYHLFLQKRLQKALDSEDTSHIIFTCQQVLRILNLAKNNKNLVEENYEYVNENIAYMENILAIYSYKTKELTCEFWSKMHGDHFQNLKDKIAIYEKSNPMMNIETLLNLYEINDLVLERLSERQLLTDEHAKILRKIFKIINLTIHFIEDIVKNQKLYDYCNMSKEQRIIQGLRYFSESGHMDISYYLEHIDPYHRMSKHINAEWQASVFCDNSFVDFLEKNKNLDDDVPQIIYLNEHQRQNILVSKNESGDLIYPKNGKILPDGKYLYVLDKNNQLYVADEKNSFFIERNQFFQHTSILNGGHIACAGELYIKNGKIVSMNNGSGHYLPTAGQLFQAIAALKHSQLINLDDPEFRVGVYGVDDIPGFIGNLLGLTIDEFLNHLDTILQIESKNRNLKPFNAMVKHPDTQVQENDPYVDSECICPVITNAMQYFENGQQLVIERKNAILALKWNPKFFDKVTSHTIQIEGQKYALTKDNFNQLKIINKTEDSHHWILAFENLNMVADKLVLSLLNGTEPKVSKEFNRQKNL